MVSFSRLFTSTVLTVVLSLCGALLSGCGSGIPAISVSIPPLPSEDLAGPCKYDLLLQDPELPVAQQPTIKGVLVIYERGDSDVLYRDATVQHTAFALNFAILWAHECNARSSGDLQADANQGPGRTLLAALDRLSTLTGHPELSSAGMILYGFSAAGVLTATFENEYPARVLGAIQYASGSEYTNLDDISVTKAASQIPTLILANATDEDSGTSRSYNYFNRGRELGAFWAYAVQNGTGHCCNISTRSVILPWIQAAAKASTTRAATSSLRKVAPLPTAVANSSFVCTPNGVKDAQGLIDCAFTSATLSSSDSPNTEKGWLPDATSGEAWLAWVTNPGTN